MLNSLNSLEIGYWISVMHRVSSQIRTLDCPALSSVARHSTTYAPASRSETGDPKTMLLKPNCATARSIVCTDARGTELDETISDLRLSCGRTSLFRCVEALLRAIATTTTGIRRHHRRDPRRVDVCAAILTLQSTCTASTATNYRTDVQLPG